MNKILLFDLIFLVAFCIGVIIFIKTRTHNLKREGWMYLYRTQWGVKKIDSFSKKYSRVLSALKVPIITLGFILMFSMIYMLIKTVYIYFAYPQITDIIKAPPVMPLIPYFPQLFGVESFLPAFYFMDFLLALIIVAVVHEFAHGIYMKLYSVKIKTTGVACLGPILGAFVEQDEKSFVKAKNSDQMTILGAGVAANIIFSGIFLLLLFGFFSATYQPAGYVFDDYAKQIIYVKDIKSYSPLSENVTLISTGNYSYVYPMNQEELISQIKEKNIVAIPAYLNSPALNSSLRGIIVEINGEKIRDQESLSANLETKGPFEEISITLLVDGKEESREITLGQNPDNSSKAFLGVSSYDQNAGQGIVTRLINSVASLKDKNTYYETRIDKDVAEYFYNLLWWIMMINFFVALFNMLPLGILDGGRFFYLAVLIVTKNEKFAAKSFKFMSRFIVLIFLAMMIAWAFAL